MSVCLPGSAYYVPAPQVTPLDPRPQVTRRRVNLELREPPVALPAKGGPGADLLLEVGEFVGGVAGLVEAAL